MAADGGMITEHFVLYCGFASSDRIEKICLVRRDVVIACGAVKVSASTVW